MAFEDDLTADIAAAVEGTAAPAVDPMPAAASPAPEVPKVEAPKTDAERARDESGRFKAKEGETEAPKVAAKTVADPAAVTPATGQPQPQQPVVEAAKITPPANWKGAGKVAWDKLPQAIQKELSEDYASRSTLQTRLDRLDSVIPPERAQVLAATYGSVEQGVQNLFALSDMAAKNPTGFLLWFAQQRGIDLTQLAGAGGAQGEQPAQPHPAEQRVAQLETVLTNFIQQQQQGQQTQYRSQVDQFASDPAHPYFNDLREDMGALLKMGRAKDLQQAYDMAAWAHPEIRTTLIDAERQKQAKDAEAIAQQARGAAVSISGSPSGAKVPVEESDDDLETTIRKAVNAVS